MLLFAPNAGCQWHIWETSSSTYSPLASVAVLGWLLVKLHRHVQEDRPLWVFVNTPAVMFHTCTLEWHFLLASSTIVPCLPVSAHLHSGKLFWLVIWTAVPCLPTSAPLKPRGVSCLSSNHGSAWPGKTQWTSLGFSGFQPHFWTKSKLKFRGSSSKFFLQWVTSPLVFFFSFTFIPL